MEEYKKALTEVYEILNFLPVEYLNKIPKEIIKLIRDNMDNDYTWYYDFDKSFYKQELSREAVAILSYINMEFFLNKEQKNLMEKIHLFNSKK